MYKYVHIVINDENKTLTLALPNNLPEGDVIGPYSAMYYHIHEGYSWVNYKDWCGTDELNISLLREKTSRTFWEYYQNDTIIVDEDFDVNENLEDIVDTLGYVPSYILKIEQGQVNLVGMECSEDTFGEGYYYYDGNNVSYDKGTPFNGEYLRCIADIHFNIKSGALDVRDQEIFIPFPKIARIYKK